MSLTPEQIKKVAKLARIRVAEDEIAHFTKELSAILDWVEQLNEVNTDNVEPMSGMGNLPLRWREDKITDGNIQDDVLANAPDAQFGCFVVPKVVE